MRPRIPSQHMKSFQRLQDVYTTSPTSYRRLRDVETMLCVYWVFISMNFLLLHQTDQKACWNQWKQQLDIFLRWIFYEKLILSQFLTMDM